ncbi:MAG: hypothetical protein R3362_05075 [Rhodothermales bacterium]|nr:hypothetical protein [Rhodothermales bacterium]
MANIPVERKSGAPWWTWLLALLALIGLIWLLASLFGDDDEPELADDADLEAVEPAPAVVGDDLDADGADGVITTLAALAAGTVNVGREVDLDNMRVLSLTGDSSLFVGPGPDPDQGVLVVLQGMNESESLPPPATGRDGEYNVDEGDMVSLEGVIAAFDETTPDYADMPAADRDRVLRDGIYVNANDVLVEDGDEMDTGEDVD